MKLLAITALNTLILSSNLFANADYHKGQEASLKSAQQNTQSLATPYLAIQKSLSEDSFEGISKQALPLVEVVNNSEVEKGLKEKIKTSAETLSKTTNLESARSEFKKLSQLMVRWHATAKPEGVKVAYCSMVKGSWLQKEEALANPYYGSKMLRCGEWIN